MAAATLAWVSGLISGGAEGATRVVLMALGALFTGTAAGVPLWQQARDSRARTDAVAAAQRARAAMRVALEDALDPFTALLLQLATAKAAEKSRLRGEAIQLALTTLAQLSALFTPSGMGGPTRVRVCFFALDPGPPRRLVPQSYAGRSGGPTQSFDETTRGGQLLMKVAHTGWLIVDDTNRQPDSSWWDADHAYRSFAAGPVPGPYGAGPAGLLTLDSLAPGEVSELDLPLIRLLSHLLSLALQL